MTRKWGMPYKGSKNQIAEKIVNFLPEGEWLYDLFGGGGAITHCAALSGKWKHIVYNEINPVVFKGFQMAVHGEFKNENRWISREDFFRLKSSDPYAAICFSFGNDLRSYAYSKECELFKKAVHYSIFFNDNSLLKEYADLSNFNCSSKKPEERKLKLQRYLKVLLKENKIEVDYGISDSDILQSQNCLERLKSLEILKRLERLKNLERLDYSEVQIENGGVIYCDIPYKNSNKYTLPFDYDRFYKWAEKTNNVFISEYDMPDNFIEVWNCEKRSTMSANGKSHGKLERIFTNQKTYDKLKEIWLI